MRKLGCNDLERQVHILLPCRRRQQIPLKHWFLSTCDHIPEDSNLKICTFLLDGIGNTQFYLPRYNTMQSAERQPTLQTLLNAVFLLGLFFSLADGDKYVAPKCWSTFNGLLSIISQKIEIFITTTVRTSNPAEWNTPYFLEYETIYFSLNNYTSNQCAFYGLKTAVVSIKFFLKM
jgi:hypothetical protein